MERYDVVVVGASFAGLSFALNLDKKFSVLVLDYRKSVGSNVRTTGLVTKTAVELLSSFIPLNRCCAHEITALSIHAPNFTDCVTSHLDFPWLYTTDIKKVLAGMAAACGPNVTIRPSTRYVSCEIRSKGSYPVLVQALSNGSLNGVECKHLVGADGPHSTVARTTGLDTNSRFLFGAEVIYEGVSLTEKPFSAVHHIWLGSETPGYGGWLAPNRLNGKEVVQIGAGHYQTHLFSRRIINKLTDSLVQHDMVRLESGAVLEKRAGFIPISGPLRNFYKPHLLLVGDAGGMCGALMGNGIKTAIIGGKAAAEVVGRHLEGDKQAVSSYVEHCQRRYKLFRYLRKQEFDRYIFDLLTDVGSLENLFALLKSQERPMLDFMYRMHQNNKSLFGLAYHLRSARYVWRMLSDVIAKGQFARLAKGLARAVWYR